MFRLQEMIKGTGAYSIAMLARRAVSIVMLPIYTRLLTPADYGILELLDLTATIISLFVGLRIGQALFYYYAKATSDKEREGYISTALLCSVIVGGAMGFAGVEFAAPLARLVLGSEAYASYFRLIMCTFSVTLTIETGFCCLRAANCLGPYLRISLVQLGASVALNLVFMGGLHMGVAGFLWRGLIVQISLAGFLIWRLLRPIQISLDRRVLVAMLRYSLPLGVSGLAMYVINSGDRFFLRQYVSLTELGIYALAYKLGMLISYIQSPFELYWSSQMFAIVGGPEGDCINVRVCTYVTMTLAFIGIVLAAFARPLIRIMAGPAFASGAEFVPWLILAYVARTVAGQFRTAFLLEKKTGEDAIVTWSGGLACLAGYALLIPSLKVWGAVIATCIGFGVMFIVGLKRAQSVRYFPYDYRRLGGIGAVTLAAVSIASFSRPEELSMQLIQGTAIVAGALAFLLLPGALEAHEKRFFSACVRGVRRRLPLAA